jgi:hypothetical protein
MQREWQIVILCLPALLYLSTYRFLLTAAGDVPRTENHWAEAAEVVLVCGALSVAPNCLATVALLGLLRRRQMSRVKAFCVTILVIAAWYGFVDLVRHGVAFLQLFNPANWR